MRELLISEQDHKTISLSYNDKKIILSEVECFAECIIRNIRKGIVYSNQDTIQYFSSYFELLEENELLMVYEPNFTGMLPMEMVPEVTESLTMNYIQDLTCESFEPHNEFLNTYLMESCIVCNRLGEGGRYFLDRVAPEGRDSGWFFGCTESSCDHNSPDVLKRESVYKVLCDHKTIMPFLKFGFNTTIEVDTENGLRIIQNGKEIELIRESFLMSKYHKAKWVKEF